MFLWLIFFTYAFFTSFSLARKTSLTSFSLARKTSLTFFSLVRKTSLTSFSLVRKRSKQEKGPRHEELAKIRFSRTKAAKLARTSFLLAFFREIHFFPVLQTVERNPLEQGRFLTLFRNKFLYANSSKAANLPDKECQIFRSFRSFRSFRVFRVFGNEKSTNSGMKIPQIRE